jgi:hypothetical protein
LRTASLNAAATRSSSEAGAGHAFHLDLGELLLHLLHVFLHLLGLLHQPGDLAFHHGRCSFKWG